MASNKFSKPSLNKSDSEDDDKSPSKSDPQEDDKTHLEEYDIFKYCIDIDSETESDPEEDDDNNDEFEEVKLEHGITMTLPNACSTKEKNMHFKPWSHERRDESLSHVDGLNTDMVSTDVYELSIETNTSGSTVRGIQDIHCMTIKVPLENIEKGKWFNYRSHILYDNKWTWTKATYFEDEGLQYVYFDTYILESFYITRSPSHEKFTVDEEGNTFTWSKDDRIQVQFPKGSVDTKEEVQVVVYPIDRVGMEWRLKNTPQNCNILAISDCLYVKSNVKKFNQQVSVQLPIDKTIEEECEFVFIHWKGNKVQNIEHSSDRKIEKVNDCYTISVDSFSGNQIAVIRPGSKGKITELEILLNSGKIKQCKVLIFVKKENPTFLSSRIEIVQIQKIEEARSRASDLQLTEISFCKSTDKFLYDKERIKIDISGNACIAKSTVKHGYFLKFFHYANDCYVDILLQIYKRMDQTTFTHIYLNTVGKQKELVHHTWFDPDTVKWISTKSMMTPQSPSDNSRSGNKVPSDPTRPPSEDHPPSNQIGTPDNKVPSDPTRPPSEEHLLPNQRRSPDNKVPSDPTRPPSEDHPPSNQIGTPDNRDFYSDKSMIWLAKHLPAKDAYEFGIHLGLKEEDTNRLKMSTDNNIIKYHMEILKSWKNSEKSANKIVVLINALKYCDLNNIAHDVEKAYKNGKMLNKDDFK